MIYGGYQTSQKYCEKVFQIRIWSWPRANLLCNSSILHILEGQHIAADTKRLHENVPKCINA